MIGYSDVSGSTLRAVSQSVALLQASHELRIGDGEHAVLPLSGDKLVAEFIAGKAVLGEEQRVPADAATEVEHMLRIRFCADTSVWRLAALFTGFELLSLTQEEQRRPGSWHWHILAERR